MTIVRSDNESESAAAKGRLIANYGRDSAEKLQRRREKRERERSVHFVGSPFRSAANACLKSIRQIKFYLFTIPRERVCFVGTRRQGMLSAFLLERLVLVSS